MDDNDILRSSIISLQQKNDELKASILLLQQDMKFKGEEEVIDHAFFWEKNTLETNN